jgi:hypothetical protein
MNFAEFITANSGMILTVIGLCGSGCAGLAVCFLKSRCRHIKCYCIELERDVLPADVVIGMGNADNV